MCPVLIGRDEQLTLLEEALSAARRGEGQLVVLAGEAGMGKTRLAGELQTRALQAGATVLWGGCSEADVALPYLPFVEAIGNFLAATDLEPLRQRLGPQRRELARLFPQFDPERSSGDSGNPSEDKLRLFEAVLALLRIAAEPNGLLCVVEDLHWADASTRELLEYLTRRLRHTRFMVLATYRADELHRKHALLPMLQAWRRATVAQVVDLPALRPAHVQAMVRAIFNRETVGSELRDFLHTRSEGNPFVLEELLKAALDRGAISPNSPGLDRRVLESMKIPPTVRDMILMRVEQLPPEQVQILRTAAVLGRSFAYSTLAAISGQEETTVKAALHTFVLQQLMEEDSQAEGRYRFRHALTREAVYEDLLAPDRAQLHAQAAAVLQTQSDTPAIDLAHHLLAGQRWDEAIDVCITAAWQLAEQQAYVEAVIPLERVLPHVRDKLTRARILGHLGTMHFFSADHRRAQPHLEESIRLLEECGQGQEAARLRWCLGGCHWPQGRWDLAQAEWEKACLVHVALCEGCKGSSGPREGAIGSVSAATYPRRGSVRRCAGRRKAEATSLSSRFKLAGNRRQYHIHSRNRTCLRGRGLDSRSAEGGGSLGSQICAARDHTSKRRRYGVHSAACYRPRTVSLAIPKLFRPTAGSRRVSCWAYMEAGGRHGRPNH